MLETIELKPSELVPALEDCLRANVIPCTLSKPGMGKSDIHKQVIRERLKMRMVDERSSSLDMVDWRGVPDIDKKRKSTVWYAPDFLPREEDDPTVVFLDEITQTPENCQAPLLQLFLDRRIGTVYQAPASARFACAGNMMDDGTFSRKLGAALRNRMVFLYLKHDLDDWCRWAYGHDVAPSVIAYLRFRPANLYVYDKNEMTNATPRSWEFVSHIVKNAKNNGRIRDSLIAGTVGKPLMIEYTGFERVFNELPSIDAILANPDVAAVPDPKKPELAYAVSNALSIKMSVTNIEKIMRYLYRLPAEYGVFAVKIALRRDPKLANTNAYTKFAVTHAEAMQ